MSSTPPHPQLQEAKQVERERHRQHSPVTQHTETESPTLQTHINPPNRAPSQAANGSVTPSTPSINVPPAASATPTREGEGRNDRSPSAVQQSRGGQAEQEEQGPAYENPDPENGSHYCVPENEQTEADQATAAAAAQSKTNLFDCDGFRWQFKLIIHG